MKLLMIIAFVLSLSANAGQRTGIYKFKAQTEADAVEQIQNIIPEIKRGAITETNIFGRRHQCTFRVRHPNSEKRIKVLNAEVNKMYKVTRDDKLEKYFEALIKFRFLKCKK